MLAAITGDPQHRVDINSRRSIIAIVYLAVVGPCVFILQPGFVQGLVEHLGLTEQQAGLIASAEMFGLATTTVLLSFVSSKVTWRNFVTLCLFICVLGNLASLGQSDFNTLAIIRYVTGLGSGGIISLTFTMMGLTERSDRNFGYIIVWVLTYGAFGLLLMPQAYATIGMNGVLVFFAAFCALGLIFVKHLPDSGEHIETSGDQRIRERLSAFVRETRRPAQRVAERHARATDRPPGSTLRAAVEKNRLALTVGLPPKSSVEERAYDPIGLDKESRLGAGDHRHGISAFEEVLESTAGLVATKTDRHLERQAPTLLVHISQRPLDRDLQGADL